MEIIGWEVSQSVRDGVCDKWKTLTSSSRERSIPAQFNQLVLCPNAIAKRCSFCKKKMQLLTQMDVKNPRRVVPSSRLGRNLMVRSANGRKPVQGATTTLPALLGQACHAVLRYHIHTHLDHTHYISHSIL